ncbi:hypothetical protein ABZ172_13730 [Streptomyces sp. NPDC006296]|uniref:hypothetical protein n=1 Tax=Streptomyces sp. NPDC006296 TaxID=3156746 RepID=UPI0033BAA535
MSDNDQQYPYDPGHGQPYQGQPHDPAYGQRPPGQPYAPQQPHDPAYGQPQPSGPYAQPQQSHDPAYGQHQQQPYNPYTQPQPGPYAQPQQPQSDAYGQPAQQPYAQQQPAVYPERGASPASVDQGPAQTWQGQTWDTRSQPTFQPQQQPSAPVPPGAPAPAGPGAHAPGVRGAGAAPLPPEAPGAQPGPAPSAPAAGAPAAAPDAAGFGAPTTLGNSRITDAQRARAEGRSPIIAPGMQPAAITAGLGLLLALGAAIGSYALLVPLVLLQAVTAAGWFRLNGMWPARQGIALAFAGGLVADAVLLAAGRGNAPAALLGTLGVWVLLTLVLQLRSHAGADERMYGLTATVASAALAVLAAGHLAAVPDAVTVGGVAVAVGVLVRALPLPGVVSVVVALLASAGAGLGAGALTDFGTQAALLGFAAGGCALIGLRVASYDYPSRFVHMTAGVALPLTAAAPAVYLIGRAIG